MAADDAKPCAGWMTQAQAAGRLMREPVAVRINIIGDAPRRGPSFRAVERHIIERLDPSLRTLSRSMRDQVMLDRLSEYGGCDS